MIKSDGQAAYIAGDLAYYLDKRERGFDRVVIMLGADHHGYIGRMMAMCAAFGDVPHVNLEILIGQMVNLVREGQPMRMSKRAGTVVTLEDLVEAVGVDAARYALARSSADSSIDIDLDLLGKHSNDNPVYYVQYAHARIAGVVRNAEAAGVRHGRRVRRLTADPRHRVGAARGAGGVPPGGRPGGRAARAPPGGALPRGARRAPATSGTTPAGSPRAGTSPCRTCTGPGSGWPRPPAPCSPTD